MAAISRDQFKSRFGFILSCVGSAVGMANIWLFPTRVGEYGGAAFLIPYVIFVVLIGTTGIIEEIAFGRAMQSGPLGAYRKAMENRGWSWGKHIGIIPIIGGLGLGIGYAVVISWILKFAAGSIDSSLFEASGHYGEYFGALTSEFGSLPWHAALLAITFIIMAAGVAKGIEKINLVLMPAFFLLFLVLAVRVFFLEGIEGHSVIEGYKYLFSPKWEFLANPKTWVYALGQAFFSLSLSGAGTLVYGSYLSKEEDVVAISRRVAFYDTLAAMVAALVIIPAVFAFGIKPSIGPSLMFITMPGVFEQMPAGQFFMVIFFIAAFFAGITSLVNIFESSMEAIEYEFKLSRPVSVGIIVMLSLAIGVFLEDGSKLGPWMDIVTIYIIPFGAIMAGVTFFWICGFPFAKEQIELGRSKPLPEVFEPFVKYVFCGVSFAVFVLGIFYGGIG